MATFVLIDESVALAFSAVENCGIDSGVEIDLLSCSIIVPPLAAIAGDCLVGHYPSRCAGPK
jgi:hypothetical protein